MLFEHKPTRRSRHPAPSSAEEDELYPRFRALATMTKLTTLILQQLHVVRVLRPLTPRTINRISCQCKCRCEVNVELFQTVGFILFRLWKSELSKWKTMCWHRVGGEVRKSIHITSINTIQYVHSTINVVLQHSFMDRFSDLMKRNETDVFPSIHCDH